MTKPTQQQETEKSDVTPAQFRSLEAREGELDQHRDEFPNGEHLGDRPDEFVLDEVDRRNFLGVMGASMALAGVSTSLTGCVRKPNEKILPYTRRPEDFVPGKPRYFATVAQVTGSVMGLLVESQDGRPIKVEGNPRHPMSLGATDTFTQASVLDLYDPCRVKAPRVAGKEMPFRHFEKRFERFNTTLGDGDGLALLIDGQQSPTLFSLLEDLRRSYPKVKIYRHDNAYPRNGVAGAKLVGVEKARPLYALERADRVLSLDMDFLGVEGDVVRNARRYSWRRRITSERDNMNRLYVVEPALSVTGSNADHRLRLAPSQVGEFLADLVGHMASQGVNAPVGAEPLFKQLAADFRRRASSISYGKFIRSVAKDLLANRKRSLVMVGERQPPRVHALAYVLNQLLDSFGRTLTIMPALEPRIDGEIGELAAEMMKSRVKTLVMLGGNPAYDAPADLEFGKLLSMVPTSIALSLCDNETTKLVRWVVPASHYLESWGELRSTDGTLAIQQPLIDPLVESVSAIEFVSWLRRGSRDGYELVRSRWKATHTNSTYMELIWRRALHDGVQRGSDKPMLPTMRYDALAGAYRLRQKAPTKDNLELCLAFDSSVFDGRFGSNAWLQELPDPLTKLTWDNAALLGVATAGRLGVKSEQLVELSLGSRKLTLPVWVMPGVAENTIVLPLGYGRKNSGVVAEGAGFDGYRLRIAATPFFAQGLKLNKGVRGSYQLASTQEHGTMVEPRTGKHRPVAVSADIGEYREYEKKKKKGERNFARKRAQMMAESQLKSIYEETTVKTGQQWGMSIDLSTCIGCNACTVACQAENSIPTVGKKEVLNGREMHWIRLDRYFEADRYDAAGQVALDDVRVVTQPVGCQHCETAPCENVCPVGATAHSPEGLNDMAYNRCIGTRYCGNNCPYKVRRFNFFNYTKRQDETHPLLAMQRNPDVTVRFRGVMEKCTYCVQRINGAKIGAKVKGNGVVRDGAVVAACQQVCPTQAIVFGDTADPNSAVSRMKRQTRDFGVLADLLTKPRTTFLAKIRNPNPELA